MSRCAKIIKKTGTINIKLRRSVSSNYEGREKTQRVPFPKFYKYLFQFYSLIYIY